MNKIKHIFIICLLVVSSQFFYTFTFAQNQAPNTGLTYECVENINGKDVYGNCGWKDLIAATVGFLNKITVIVLELSVFIIAWAGFKYMTSGGNSGKRDKANAILWSLAQGIAIIMAAWLIVNLIATSLPLRSDIPKIIGN